MADTNPPAPDCIELAGTPGGASRHASGDWALARYRAPAAAVEFLRGRTSQAAAANLGELGALYTAGARLLFARLGAKRLTALADRVRDWSIDRIGAGA